MTFLTYRQFLGPKLEFLVKNMIFITILMVNKKKKAFIFNMLKGVLSPKKLVLLTLLKPFWVKIEFLVKNVIFIRNIDFDF